MKDEINRMLVIDIDSERINNEVRLLNMLKATHRDRLAEDNWNTDENLRLATEAVSMLIRMAEAEGVYEKGAAIRKVINRLNTDYIDIDHGISIGTHDEFGKMNNDFKLIKE